MKYRYVLLQLRRDQQRYLEYLKTPHLIILKKVKVCQEVCRLQQRIEKIEQMPFSEADKDSGDFTITTPSIINKQ